MTWVGLLDVLSALCFLTGAGLCLSAAIGLIRFPDLLSRIHAASKPQVLGLLLVCLGAAIRVHTLAAVGTLVLIVLFQLATVPISAHMLARAAYRTGQVREEMLIVDELASELSTSDPEV